MAAHTHDLNMNGIVRHGEVDADTVEEIKHKPARVRTADARLSHLILSTGWLIFIVMIFWLVYNGRVERERLESQQVIAVVAANGQIEMTPVANLRAGPDDLQIHAYAAELIGLIHGAGTGDYATRFGYAEARFTEAGLKDFRDGLGSDAVRQEFEEAKAGGAEFWMSVDVPEENVRQLTPEDLTGVKIPARLEYQQIIPRFDVYVEGTATPHATRAPEKQLPPKRFAYWVRLIELERRVKRFPHALIVEHVQPLRLPAPNQPKPAAETTKEVQQ